MMYFIMFWELNKFIRKQDQRLQKAVCVGSGEIGVSAGMSKVSHVSTGVFLDVFS